MKLTHVYTSSEIPRIYDFPTLPRRFDVRDFGIAYNQSHKRRKNILDKKRKNIH